MKIWNRIARIFRRNRMEEDRRKELNYRLKAADARRRANKMKRDAENARNVASDRRLFSHNQRFHCARIICVILFLY